MGQRQCVWTRDTGALATLGMGDLTTWAGWTSGWDTGLADNGGSTSPDRKAFGINNCLIRQISDRWSAGTRVEWWRPQVGLGNDEDLYGLTLGLNWKPKTLVLFRPEIRWNCDDAGVVIPASENNRFGAGPDSDRLLDFDPYIEK